MGRKANTATATLTMRSYGDFSSAKIAFSCSMVSTSLETRFVRGSSNFLAGFLLRYSCSTASSRNGVQIKLEMLNHAIAVLQSQVCSGPVLQRNLVGS